VLTNYVSRTDTQGLDTRRPGQKPSQAVQQGRSKRRGEEVQTALRVGCSPIEWVLANGKTPPVLPIFEGRF